MKATNADVVVMAQDAADLLLVASITGRSG